MSKVVIKYGHVYSAVARNHSSPQAQEAQNNQVYAGLIENVTCAPVNMHHSWPFTFRSIQSTTIDGFKRPRAITIIPGGDVLVLECDGKCVSRIMANERVQLPHGNVCPLQWSTGIAAYQQVQGGQVYIFVVDRRNNSVEKFQLSLIQNNLTYCGTTQADVHAGVQNGVGGVFKSPVGIVVHPRTHRVYVADTGNHRIQILDENLNFIGNFSGRGQFKRPHDISFVDDGNNVTMYVADHGNSRIQVFTANDIVYSGPGGGAQVQATGAGGSIFAIQGNRILKHTQAGELVERIPDDGVAGGGNLQFRNPEAIAVYPVTGRVYVADTQNHRIKALDADLGFIRHLPVNGVVPGDGNNQFLFPKGIAINTVTGRVYTYNHRIKVLDADLKFIRHLPTHGVVSGGGDNQFRFPSAIAVHPVRGRVYVADTENHRIKVLDADLKFIRQLPAHGVVPGDGNNQFRFPKGITINTVTGRVYVADTGNHRIKVLVEDLNILSHYENDQFDRPHDISLAMVGNNVQMRVTDRHNNQ